MIYYKMLLFWTNGRIILMSGSINAKRQRHKNQWGLANAKPHHKYLATVQFTPLVIDTKHTLQILCPLTLGTHNLLHDISHSAMTTIKF